MQKLARNTTNAVSLVWKSAFFRDENTIPLEVVRFGVGFLLLFNYGMYSWDDLFFFYGANGFLAAEYFPEMSTVWRFSVFGVLTNDFQVLVFHYLNLLLCFCLMVGWKANWVKWLVLLAHLSYLNRNPVASYGVDTVAIALLIPLCFAPIGKALSIDRLIAVRRHKRANGLNTRPVLPTSRMAFGATRLIQIQMAVLYFSSGIEKLYGDEWWAGTALWTAMVNNETAFFPMGFFASHFWLMNLMAFATILIELAYPFLIWGHKTRPFLLAAALFLHAGIAIFLGMYYFAALMSFGHLAFVRREWYQAAGNYWKNRFGKMEMLWDGNCGFCKASMEWFLSFDGLSQVSATNYHESDTKLVTKDQASKALYTITSDNRTFSGFDAYRHVVLRVPGLWIFVPLFCIPLVSRAVGEPLYKWIASHRMQMSKLLG